MVPLMVTTPFLVETMILESAFLANLDLTSISFTSPVICESEAFEQSSLGGEGADDFQFRHGVETEIISLP